jgi:La-related protein 7
LSVFLTFNKIKEILSKGGNESTIRKALSRSEVLEFSEDNTKIRRKEEIPTKSQEDMDECTLYVEQVPLNSTHDSLKELFSRFGKVVYVSLPKYKKSQKIKQFGFVEFENKESIIKAINTFKKCDNVLQYASVKAENLLSIATHDKEIESDGKVEDKIDEKTEVKNEKHEDEFDEPPSKKMKVVEDEKPEETQEESETETSKVSASEKETEDEEKHEDDDGVTKKKKKNRKHKKKSKTNTLVEQHILAMKIMRKKDWKKMRNAYLNMERQKAKEIKKILRDSYNKRNNNKIQESPRFSQLSTASPKINFYNYGSPIGQDDRTEASGYEPLSESKPTSGLVFTPGVIVNIKFREPCSDFKELKKEFKQFSYVNYVDMLEGGSQCYIRCETPASAQELVQQYSSCEYETEVLKDEPEKEYWKKIFDKRDSIKNSTRKSNPIKRRRGRERLLDKIQKAAGTHVRFDETEEMNVE